MADGNLPTVSIPGFGYTAGTTNIGEGYAKGIQSAGESIGKGLGQAMDVMNRRQNATDMLNALHQGGMLSDDQYKSVAGKSLGAQEQMLGMYANQWILDQANKRAISLEQGKGGVDVATTHAKMLDLINYTRSPTGKPGAAAWTGPTSAPAPANQVVAPTQQQSNVAQQQALGFGTTGGTPSLGVPNAAAPPAPPAAQAQTSAEGKPPLPGSIRVVDNATGKKGWKLPSGQIIPD